MTQSSAPSGFRTAGVPAQLFGVAAGPAGWIAQLVVNYGVSSHLCFLGDAPRATAPPPGEHAVLLAVSLACLALALFGLWVSLAGLRRRPVAIADDLLATAPGRSRFLAMCGVLSASAFAIAIAFDIPSTLALRLCWSIPQ
ncbi:MAG TPA: hypothetical protein VFE18_04535 [Phenylobacterium sp.]|jgi:hypothetical protein|uniref:hypothetical protein n=1 Tax=Phenylobacterium sp. TaxID=1871053 RepID=UPI002D260EA4|nr:hypothetical protein [Phenylobacterium sp.]HZZ67420.1 hypothetical protein [Phenylobacterium sp.]